MKNTTNRGLILLALLVFSVSVEAQKLYKIVDEDGNITFSQYPPPEKQENATIDEHTVSGGGQSVPMKKNGDLYCGEIQLPEETSSRQSMSSRVRSLESQQRSWRQEQARLVEQIDTSNQNKIKQEQYRSRYSSGYSSGQSQYYKESVDRNSARMRDLRCAVDWVDAELDGKSEQVASDQKERDRLKGIRNELQSRLDRRCGELPAYDPSDAYNSTARKDWYDCSELLREEIDRVDRAIAGV